MVARLLTLTLNNDGVARKLVLKKTRQETYLHILIKVLAYIYFWSDELEIEPNLRYHGYKPDLLRMDDNPNPKIIDKEIGLWVECKQVKLKKLDDLVRYCNAPIYWFHTLHHLSRSVTKRQIKKYTRLSKVHIIGIDSDDHPSGLTGLDRLIKDLSSDRTTWSIRPVGKGDRWPEILVFNSHDIDPVNIRYIQYQVS